MWWASLKNSLMVLGLACGCTLKPSLEPPVRLYLASSLYPLKSSLEKLAPKDLNLDLQFLSSSMIAHQVGEGASCDAVVLADEQWQEYLEKKQAIKGLKRTVATNSLVLASLKQAEEGSLAQILRSLRGERQIIVADPEYVPLGRYSQQALKALGLWELIRPKAIYAHSAHNALVLLEQGAAPYALLYRSDIHQGRLHQIAALDPSLHKAISYVFVACKEGSQAQALERLLFSPEFAAELRENNFGMP